MTVKTKSGNYASPLISENVTLIPQEIICGSLGTEPYEEQPIDWD